MSSNNDWSGEIPSWQETEARAADESEARRDRRMNVLVGVFVLGVAVLLGWAVYLIGGGWS